jgi:hypothetical protein
MVKRIAFVTVWLGTAFLVFTAQALEYSGFKFLTTAEVLTGTSAIGTLVFTLLAFRSFWKANSAQVVPVVFGLACMPFVLGKLLSLNGTEPNVHGAAIFGMFFYSILSEVTAVTLLLTLIVRSALRRRKAPSVSET